MMIMKKMMMMAMMMRYITISCKNEIMVGRIEENKMSLVHSAKVLFHNVENINFLHYFFRAL